MAKTLKKYNWAAKTPSVRPKTNYPWQDWFDGQIWKLTHGEDFQCHPLMMERIVRTRATSKQAKVQVRHEDITGDPDNPFGVLIIQRTNLAPEASNGHKPVAAAAKKAPVARAAKATASKAAPKAAASKAPARKAAAVRPAPARAPRAAKAPAAPAVKAAAVRAPRTTATKATAPAKAVASKKAAAPVASKSPAKRGPRTVKVETAASLG